MVRSVFCLLLPLVVSLFSDAQEAIQSASKIEDSISKFIHLSSKTLVKDNKILLQWEAGGAIDFYIVERSIDERQFEVIGVIKAKSVGSDFEFLDERPSRKVNHYRIRMQVSDEKNVYSETIAAAIADSVFCKFYPNPVDKLLILRSDYAAEVKITDIMGNIRIVQKLKPGVQILDVSSLEKNVYVITIYHQESNLFITQKLVKN